MTTNILFPNITAEHIMTSREQWLAVQPGSNRESIIAEARRQRYDLVPVLDASYKVISFLQSPDYDEKPLTLDW